MCRMYVTFELTLGDNPLGTTPAGDNPPTENTPDISPIPTRGPDPDLPTTCGSDPNPNRPTGRELSEN